MIIFEFDLLFIILSDENGKQNILLNAAAKVNMKAIYLVWYSLVTKA